MSHNHGRFILLGILLTLYSVFCRYDDINLNCPNCLVVMKIINEYSHSHKVNKIDALNYYCSLKALNVRNQQFCYNIENIKYEINRLLYLNVENEKICEKVRSINKGFCNAVLVELDSSFYRLGSSHRGVIYE